MKKNLFLKLKDNVQIKKSSQEGIIFDSETEFVYEASNDVIDFIKSFEGNLPVSRILEDLKENFELSKDEIEEILSLIQELISEKILVEVHPKDRQQAQAGFSEMLKMNNG